MKLFANRGDSPSAPPGILTTNNGPVETSFESEKDFQTKKNRGKNKIAPGFKVNSIFTSEPQNDPTGRNIQPSHELQQSPKKEKTGEPIDILD